MARLVITKGEQQGESFEVERPEVVFGRLAECDVTLHDRKASRRHARLVERDGGYEVEDLESANGTMVNGQRVRKRRLYGGDVITIGTTDIRFQAGVARARPAAASQAAPAAEGTKAASPDFRPEDIRVRDEPLQFSPHKDASAKSLLGQDLLQEGGLFRVLLVVLGLALLVGAAVGTAWLMRSVL